MGNFALLKKFAGRRENFTFRLSDILRDDLERAKVFHPPPSWPPVPPSGYAPDNSTYSPLIPRIFLFSESQTERENVDETSEDENILPSVEQEKCSDGKRDQSHTSTKRKQSNEY